MEDIVGKARVPSQKRMILNVQLAMQRGILRILLQLASSPQRNRWFSGCRDWLVGTEPFRGAGFLILWSMCRSIQGALV